MGVRGVSGAGGRVGNAYDTAQSAGGSASGSGAAVGAGLVPLAVGSDTCGTLRIPAAYNGAVALRATYGRFDTSGIFPIGFVNLVPGVIARETAMLRAALAVAGDGWRAGGGGGLRGMRVGVLRRFNRKGSLGTRPMPTRRRFSGRRSPSCAGGRRDRRTRRARQLRRAARAGIPQGVCAQGRCRVRQLSRRPAKLARRLRLRPHPPGMERQGVRGGRRLRHQAGAAGRRIGLRAIGAGPLRCSTSSDSTPCSTRWTAAAARAATPRAR